MPKKPSIKPEQRRQWLKRNEEDGESPLQISEKDYFDIRTIRVQLELARQEREMREARSMALRDALQAHFDDLRKYAERLNSEIMEYKEVPRPPDDDLIAAALRQHLPRSPIWAHMARRQDLKQRQLDERINLDNAIKRLVMADNRLEPLIGAGLSDVVNGVTDALITSAQHWIKGETKFSLKENPSTLPEGKGLVRLSIGSFFVGIVKETRVDERWKAVSSVLAELELMVKESQQYRDLEKTIDELSRLRTKLREELAIIRLKRIVPGRCDYCPL